MDTTKSSVPTTTREQRGIQLYREQGHHIAHVRGSVWSVPSCSGAGVYLVDVKGGPCTCPDTPPADEVCKHVVAAMIAKAKTATCAGCGLRFPRRELVEVGEEQDGLMHHEGDVVCLPCGWDHGVL